MLYKRNMTTDIGQGGSYFTNVRERGQGPSVLDLPTSLTINGTTVQAQYVYYGKDATATTWTCGGGTKSATGDMTLVGSGSNPTPTVPKVFSGSSNNKAILYGEGASNKIHAVTSDNTVGDVGTDDFVIEAVVRMNPGADSQVFMSHLAAGSNNPGWFLVQHTSGYFYLWIGGDGATSPNHVSVYTNLTTKFSRTAWVHAMWFADRSGACQGYANNVKGNAPNITSQSATMSVDVPLKFGTTTNIGGYNELVYTALWHSAGWLDSHTQDDIVDERYKILNGTKDGNHITIHQSKNLKL